MSLTARCSFTAMMRSTTVRRGETFYLQGKSFHYIANENRTLAKVLWISTPPLF